MLTTWFPAVLDGADGYERWRIPGKGIGGAGQGSSAPPVVAQGRLELTGQPRCVLSPTP
jgi:hypothetical protein